MQIATSILNASNKLESIIKLNNTNTDYIHIDVMDNIFVPNYSLPIEEVNMLGKNSNKPFDIHLMLDNPLPFIENLNITNIKSITIHLEINKNIKEILEKIKKLGYQAGLAIKPNTDINLLDEYLSQIDKVIVMSVEPGFGGQKFIDNSIERIKNIREKKKQLIIEVDGGINDITINKIKGISDIAVVGSYITKQEDYNKAINKLKN